MSTTTLSELPGQLAQVVILGAAAAALGYLAYQLGTSLAEGRREITPLSIGGVVLAAGGAATALILAAITLWAIALTLVVVGLFAWWIANS